MVTHVIGDALPADFDRFVGNVRAQGCTVVIVKRPTLSMNSFQLQVEGELNDEFFRGQGNIRITSRWCDEREPALT